ncbi:peptidase M20 [Deltaproteobacteria bacterium Smac51]|nr:peptidase M20 [Deltaproteobacteria bacterium Smac51]
MAYPLIVEEFLELVQIEAHSRRERLIAEALKPKLAALGFTVEEDDTGEKIGGDCGSLIARLPGDPAKPAILFSAHMDRVENHGRIKPLVLEAEDVIRSDGSSILAADDISGVCAILDGVRRVLDEKIPHGDIEIVFSVAEEVGLLGARYLDYGKIKSKMAYVIDAGGPMGTIVNQAPSQYTLDIKIYGKSAHAGIEPENGINAVKVAAAALAKMREGRLSPASTSNFGIIRGGKATNIVCDFVEIEAEARSTDPQELEAYVEEVKKVFAETAAEWGTRIEVEPKKEYSTYRVDENNKTIQLAVRALKNLGIAPSIVSSGGGSDGNFFNANGVNAIGISPGYSKVHTPHEEQPISDLIRCGQLVAEIIREAGR